MFFSILKYLQLLTGLTLTGLFLAAPFVIPVLYPDAHPFLFASDFYSNSPSGLLILAAAFANLMAGFYQNAMPFPRKPLQILASLAFLSAAVLATGNMVLRLFVDPTTAAIPELTVYFLLAGLGLHALCNLHQLNPFSSSRKKDTVQINSSRENGTVKWFNVSKGFGFITRDSGEDIFVHYRAIRGDGHRALSEGQRVDFTVAHKDKGLQAEDVNVRQK